MLNFLHSGGRIEQRNIIIPAPSETSDISSIFDNRYHHDGSKVLRGHRPLNHLAPLNESSSISPTSS